MDLHHALTIDGCGYPSHTICLIADHSIFKDSHQDQVGRLRFRRSNIQGRSSSVRYSPGRNHIGQWLFHPLVTVGHQ
jgi:hypothetical protein